MALILLPGLHGSGELFQPLLSKLALPSQVIELPVGGDQSREFLAGEISKQLPNDQNILIAESFSGCLIPEIIRINPDKIAGVIFVASFISNPNKLLLRLSCMLPDSVMRNAILVRFVLKQLFLNGNSDKKLLNSCVRAVLALPQSVIKARLKTMNKLVKLDVKRIFPVVYLRATNDRVVARRHAKEIEVVFQSREIQIDGPHFLLQAAPIQSAVAIRNAVEKIRLINRPSPKPHSAV